VNLSVTHFRGSSHDGVHQASPWNEKTIPSDEAKIESLHQLYRVIMAVSEEDVGIAMGVTGVGPGHCAQDLTGWGYRAPQDAQIVTNGGMRSTMKSVSP